MNSITLQDLRDNFPYPEIRKVQDEALQKIAESESGVLLEIPTGEGKTGIGLATLRAFGVRGLGPLFYVTPTKTQVDQIANIAGRTAQKMLGRSEYPCLYYMGKGVEGVNAQESPCYLLKCKHRVDQSNGQTEEPNAEPCPYLQAKYEARTQTSANGTVVCTTAFFLTNRLMVEEWRNQEPALVVVDEVHRLAKTARSVFEYTMTDFNLKRAANAINLLDPKQARIIEKFRTVFMAIARKRSSRAPSLLKEEEVSRLIAILEGMDTKRLLELLTQAIDSGQLDPVQDQGILKLLENIGRNIPRFISSLKYACENEQRRPLNYVVAFYYKKDDPEFVGGHKRVRYYLTIRSYFVQPIIKRVFGERIIGYSATIGDPQILFFETGLKLPFHSFGSSFPTGRTKIFLPSDTRNLAKRSQSRHDLNKTLREIIRRAGQFAQAGHRSLVVVVSDEERRKFLQFAKEAGLATGSYGNNGVTARQSAQLFIQGQGQVLVGTVAQYGEGVDLPKGLAPVIFFLRPGYQRPDAPETQFEERRFSQGHCWALWNWRVMIEALQVRGRNVRTNRDLGVCFFMSRQFHRFLFAALPSWLKPAYKSDLSLEQAVTEAMELLKG